MFGYAHGNKNIVAFANNNKLHIFCHVSSNKNKSFVNMYFFNAINTICNTLDLIFAIFKQEKYRNYYLRVLKSSNIRKNN